MKLLCDHGHVVDDSVLQRTCHCGAALQYQYTGPVSHNAADRTMWAYTNRLPAHNGRDISLGEGGTPLIKSRLDLGCDVYWKNETRNPTGSQKDRALAVAIAAGAERGAKRVIMASTGSAGLSCSAYAARANMECYILCPGDTATERLAAMHILGANVLCVDGSFEALMAIITTARQNWGYYETTTYRRANPYQADGPKTIAYEIAADLVNMPDAVIVPVGGGGTLSGIWRGFKELKEIGLIDKLPKMIAVQNEHFNALAIALERGLGTEAEIVELDLDPDVPVVTANLKHSVPPDALDALAALRESRGEVVTITDEEALAAQVELGRHDGIFAEPSSTVGLVAVRKLIAARKLGKNDQVVAVVTGSGLREMEAVLRCQKIQIPRVSVAEALKNLNPA